MMGCKNPMVRRGKHFQNSDDIYSVQLRRALRQETVVRRLLLCAALISGLVVCAILVFLAYFSLPLLFQGQGARILAWRWRPFQGDFGILPMVIGSCLLAFSALLSAYPLGLGLCGFAFRQQHKPWGRLVLGIVRLMTGVPTVVYGFVSVFLLVPLIRSCFAQGTGFCWLTACLTLSLLILPTIVLLIWAQLEQTAPEVRLAAMAVGLTPSQELLWVHLPQASRGLVAAAVLGFGRAAGDTLVALMLAGNAAQIPYSPLDSLRTLTSHIALIVATDSTSLAYQSVFAAGLILFGLAATVNLALRWLKSPPL
jgi:phosphate transport system permease protein